MGKGKRGGFKFWHLTLAVAVVALVVFVAAWAGLASRLHMETLLDFFVIVAEIGVVAQYAGIALVVAIVAGIATVPLAITRR